MSSLWKKKTIGSGMRAIILENKWNGKWFAMLIKR